MIYGKPVILVSFVLLFDVCQACPSLCVCKWKSGKQTVECNNRDLLIIPEGMDSGTQVLEFNGNNLHALHSEKFLKLDLINLQKIYLSGCRIKIIEQRTFKGLTNLVELDLSGNMLENVPSETFLDCPSLMRLTLSDNPIKTLRKAAFSHLSFLSTLELSNCELSRVEEDAFQGLLNLEWLHLDKNKLAALNGLGVLSKSLKGIELQGNPWECDCHLTDLHAWLSNVNIALTVEPVCSGPTRLTGQTIKSVPESELACLPDVSPTTFYLEIGEGKNVSLLCNVKAIPPAKVSWWFQGQLLQNDSVVAPGLHLLYFIEEGATEKQSELLIFNANADDNGTFICSAENAAGVTQSNFTIRVVIKEISTESMEALPVEHIIMLMSAAAVSVLMLLSVIIVFVLKCSRASGKPKESDKHSIENLNKTPGLLQGAEMKRRSSLKQKTVLTDVSDEVIIGSCSEAEIVISPTFPDAKKTITSPLSARCSIEQNPDLINGVETVDLRREGDGKCIHQRSVELRDEKLPRKLHPQCNLYSFSPDVHLNPVGLFCPESSRVQQACYKTLPYNKASRRQSAAHPAARYSREAEFLARSANPASYEHYFMDVRYTADGYPVRQGYLPSPPESHKSDSVVNPCCSAAVPQWPSCVPSNLLKTDSSCSVSKKSVGAQTQTECDESAKPSAPSKPVHKSLCNVTSLQDALTESPDEGYEGESLETNTS